MRHRRGGGTVPDELATYDAQLWEGRDQRVFAAGRRRQPDTEDTMTMPDAFDEQSSTTRVSKRLVASAP